MVEHRRDQLGRILEVGVEHHDRVAAGVVEPRGQRRLVAEVARQLHDTHARVTVGEALEQHRRAVAGAVVDQHELEPQPLERRADARVELLDRLLLVVDRRHDADQIW